MPYGLSRRARAAPERGGWRYHPCSRYPVHGHMSVRSGLLNRPEFSTSLTPTNTIQHVPITKVSLLQSDMHTNSKSQTQNMGTCPRAPATAVRPRRRRRGSGRLGAAATRPNGARLLSPFTRLSRGRARALRCGNTAQTHCCEISPGWGIPYFISVLTICSCRTAQPPGENRKEWT